MIQFNLLPDVKIEYIKTRNRKRMMMMISIIASAVALAIFILLFLYVRVNQTKYIGDLTKDIDKSVKEIKKTEDLDKMLTIQNQLNSLPALHEKKVVSSRLVDYLAIIKPGQASVSTVDVDFTTNTLTLQGTANSVLTISRFVESLKSTEYKVNEEVQNENEKPREGKAFKDVVLKSFSVSGSGGSTNALSTGQSNGLSYNIGLTFDPVIFSQIKNQIKDSPEAVTLTVIKKSQTDVQIQQQSGGTN